MGDDKIWMEYRIFVPDAGNRTYAVLVLLVVIIHVLMISSQHYEFFKMLRVLVTKKLSHSGGFLGSFSTTEENYTQHCCHCCRC